MARRSEAADMTRAALRLWLVAQAEFGELGVTAHQYRVLAQLADRGSTGPSALAEQLSMLRPHFSNVAEVLVANGWAAREHAADDKRRAIYHLTAEGRALLRELEARVRQAFLEAARRLEPASEEIATRGLVLWAEALPRGTGRRLRLRREARRAAQPGSPGVPSGPAS